MKAKNTRRLYLPINMNMGPKKIKYQVPGTHSVETGHLPVNRADKVPFHAPEFDSCSVPLEE